MEGQEMSRDMRTFLERGVAALEKMADDPVIQVETKPPVCPRCNTINPKVRVQEAEEEGRLAEFIIQCHCLHCNQVFYALPLQFDVAASVSEASQLIQERAEIGGYGRED